MKIIEVIQGQSLVDISVQEYGTAEAMFVILEDNPLLVLEDLTDEVPMGTMLRIREEDVLLDKKVLSVLNGKKVSTWQEQ